MKVIQLTYNLATLITRNWCTNQTRQKNNLYRCDIVFFHRLFKLKNFWNLSSLRFVLYFVFLGFQYVTLENFKFRNCLENFYLTQVLRPFHILRTINYRPNILTHCASPTFSVPDFWTFVVSIFLCSEVGIITMIVTNEFNCCLLLALSYIIEGKR